METSSGRSTDLDVSMTTVWYSENGLKMNSNKTQCILFATPNFNKRTETFQITIDDTVRHMDRNHSQSEIIFTNDERTILKGLLFI